MSLKIEEDIGWGGGKLSVDPSGYMILFYLPGPDRRYSGEVFAIRKTGIASTIESYMKAFERYEALKQIVPKGANLEERMGELNIRVGSLEGVCMRHYHNPVRSRTELNRLVSILTIVKDKRGPELMETAARLKNGWLA